MKRAMGTCLWFFNSGCLLKKKKNRKITIKIKQDKKKAQKSKEAKEAKKPQLFVQEFYPNEFDDIQF